MSQPAEARILTIVLNYRTAEMTLKAIEAAVREMEALAGAITVVDNDSGDGSYEFLSRAVKERGWSRVRVLQSGHNGGYGAGNNFGVRQGLPDGSSPDFIYILNSDAFPEPGAIQALAAYLQAHPEVGFAGSRVHGEDGEYHQTAFRFPTILSEFESGAATGPISKMLRNYIVAMPEPEEAMVVDWLVGASLMVRHNVFESVGRFDERFFLYYEETDLCQRARQAGWLSAYLPQSRVMHIESASTGMKSLTRLPPYWFDSRLWYFTKTHGAPYAATATLALFAGALITKLRRLFRHGSADQNKLFLGDLVSHTLRCAWHRRIVGHVSTRSA